VLAWYVPTLFDWMIGPHLYLSSGVQSTKLALISQRRPAKFDCSFLALDGRQVNAMSYYFAIIGTQDNPLFEYEFGTSKQGGDGQARFNEEARHLNQFVLHSSLDIVEEAQWTNGQMYAPHNSSLSFFLLASPPSPLPSFPVPVPVAVLSRFPNALLRNQRN
jgi:hypothetical protein